MRTVSHYNNNENSEIFCKRSGISGEQKTWLLGKRGLVERIVDISAVMSAVIAVNK